MLYNIICKNLAESRDEMQANGLKRREETLLDLRTVSMLTALHEYKIRQNEAITISRETQKSLAEARMIQSAEAFSEFSYFVTDTDRLKKLALDKTIPKTSEEQEIAGFRDILRVIDENFSFIPITSGQIQQLHKGLYQYVSTSVGGQFLSAEKAKRLDELCEEYESVLAEAADPLLLIPMFILDFLVLSPFVEGNEPMSGILALLLLYRAGYLVGRYVSIGRKIESSREEYRRALEEYLQRRCKDDDEGVQPFVQYILKILKAAYEEFFERVKIYEAESPKPDQIREVIKSTSGKITKSEILRSCPMVSQVTVQRTLNELVKSGAIEKIGGGRYTQYIWKEKEE